MTRPRFPVWAALITMCVLLVAGCSFLTAHRVHLPRTPPANTLITFYLRPSGDADARYYSAGLTAALAQTLNGVRPPVVYQASPYGDTGPLRAQRSNPGSLSPKDAIKVVKAMGARYGLCGDLQVKGDDVKLSLQLVDAKGPSGDKQVNAAGKLADLSALEPALARQIIAAMRLRVSDEQSNALGKAGFANPKTLLLIGKALLTRDHKQSLAATSRAWKAEPASLLATYHVLAQFSDAETAYKDIAKSEVLPQVIGGAAKRFASDPSIKESLARLSIRKYQFSTAEVILSSVVEASPDSIVPHSLLSYAGAYRYNWDQAAEEAEKAVKIWPTSPGLHADLAQAYARKAAAERNRHPAEKLSAETRKRWEADSKAALDEASAAVKMDGDCLRAWQAIMAVSLDTGQEDEAMRAFKQVVRIDPTNVKPYLAFLSTPASGERSGQKGDAVLALAARNLSPRDANVVRGASILAGKPSRQQLIDALRLAGKALRQSKDYDSDTFELTCRVMMGLGQTADAVTLARMAFGEDPSPKWRALLANAYIMHSRTSRDQAAVSKAEELMADYVGEISGDPYGHSLLGYCLMAQGKRSEAVSEFKKASDLDPNDQNAAYWLKRMR